MSAGAATPAAFRAHLDECAQCERNPFALCTRGVAPMSGLLASATRVEAILCRKCGEEFDAEHRRAVHESSCGDDL